MKQESSIYHQSKSAIELEHDIVEKAKKNARDFAPIYKKYHAPILQFVYLRLDDKDVAIDITQQVFLKAIENLQKYEFRGLPFSSWLYRIAINELNQLFRMNKKMRTINLNESITSDLINEMEDEDLTLHKDTLAIILKKLSADDFQLIEMRFFEKRPFKEIADLLNITENNAKVKAYRVIQKLKNLFKAETV